MDIDCRIPSLAHQDLRLPLPGVFSQPFCGIPVPIGALLKCNASYTQVLKVLLSLKLYFWLLKLQFLLQFFNYLNLKHIVRSLCLFINGDCFCGVTLISLAAYAFLSCHPVHPICLIRHYLHPHLFSPNTGIHFSLHCGNWHSMVGAIVNMAVWDWYKEAPVTPQAKLVCEAGRGCCLLCWGSLCRFAVGPFLIAFSYNACRLALHI